MNLSESNDVNVGHTDSMLIETTYSFTHTISEMNDDNTGAELVKFNSFTNKFNSFTNRSSKKKKRNLIFVTTESFLQQEETMNIWTLSDHTDGLTNIFPKEEEV